MEDYILQFIPVGSRNAIKRDRLSMLSGIPDRKLRRAIHRARRKIPIINLSDGGGYYIPDMNEEKDRLALKLYVEQEESRLKSIGWALKASRKTLQNCGM